MNNKLAYENFYLPKNCLQSIVTYENMLPTKKFTYKKIYLQNRFTYEIITCKVTNLQGLCLRGPGIPGNWCGFGPNCHRLVTSNDMEFPLEAMSHFLHGYYLLKSFIMSSLMYVFFMPNETKLVNFVGPLFFFKDNLNETLYSMLESM